MLNFILFNFSDNLITISLSWRCILQLHTHLQTSIVLSSSLVLLNWSSWPLNWWWLDCRFLLGRWRLSRSADIWELESARTCHLQSFRLLSISWNLLITVTSWVLHSSMILLSSIICFGLFYPSSTSCLLLLSQRLVSIIAMTELLIFIFTSGYFVSFSFIVRWHTINCIPLSEIGWYRCLFAHLVHSSCMHNNLAGHTETFISICFSYIQRELMR